MKTFDLDAICRDEKLRAKGLLPDKPIRRASRSGETAQAHYRTNLQAIDRARDKGCLTCPEKDPRCLDFHHTDPALKAGTISSMLRTASPGELLEELAKCAVLCANCHRKLHNGNIAQLSSL